MDEIAERFGAPELTLGSIVVAPLAAESIRACASVIDQRSGDPMTVPLWPFPSKPGALQSRPRPLHGAAAPCIIDPGASA